MTDLKKFHEVLNSHSAYTELSRSETGEAFQNLTGFISLLIHVNEREQVITTKQKDSDHENQ